MALVYTQANLIAQLRPALMQICVNALPAMAVPAPNSSKQVIVTAILQRQATHPFIAAPPPPPPGVPLTALQVRLLA